MSRPPCVAVAYSGGRDSTALLHATLVAAAPAGLRVLALHVHHGLSPHADAWREHCDAACARWASVGLPVEFHWRRATGAPARGDSVEAWARAARYRALTEMAQACDAGLVLLAQHRLDQAETFVLQAMRGAGVSGLSGMPRSLLRDGITWVRPWLARPRADIEAYVQAHRLVYVDDDSNSDERYARNRLRSRVWPTLEAAFPGVDSALADAATWAQEASACLDELAALDLPTVTRGEALDLIAWATLSAPRRSNVLRAWLKGVMGSAASATLVRRLMDELSPGGVHEWPAGEGAVLRSHRGRLRWTARRPSPPNTPVPETTLGIRRAGRYALPGWGGQLIVERVKQGGVPLAWLGQVDLRDRQGAEQFQGEPGRPPRSLKKQYQAAGIPAWQRAGPLLYSGGQLLFVPGLGLDVRVLALPGQAQVSLAWVV